MRSMEEIVAELSDEKLKEAFEEIVEWRKDGVLKTGVIRNIYDTYVKQGVTYPFHMMESPILFEISKRSYIGKKSKQVIKLRKKLGTRIPLSKLEEMLKYEKSYKIDGRDYYGVHGYDDDDDDDDDDDGYTIDSTRKEARIELLEELIRSIK
ncbi:hypothetical protein BH753_gp007 [Bacillus phage Shbh1]|uniref:Uncharacterized protein n=1 Tax=Bacillus phage Shbh1 TaxID=1796992 RepID=A0A142F132_9CAUD|nr:hypothetical protein BH753_gp007 [Bacillus phage Shbh1]AMQ66489.1 hypothetical protein [Bacillus phage Shbh1]